MGMTATADLAFGYVIYDDENGLLVDLTDDSPLRELLSVNDDDYTDDEDDDDHEVAEAMERIQDILLEHAGFNLTEPEYPEGENYRSVAADEYREEWKAWSRERDSWLHDIGGVGAYRQGYECGRWVLGTKAFSAYWAYEGEIAASALNVTEEDEGYLQDAFYALGIIPPRGKNAQWWLAASYG